MPVSLAHPDTFVARHIGPDDRDVAEMLRVVGKSSLDELIDQTIPGTIRLRRPLVLPPALSEHELLEKLGIAGRARQSDESDGRSAVEFNGAGRRQFSLACPLQLPSRHGATAGLRRLRQWGRLR